MSENQEIIAPAHQPEDAAPAPANGSSKPSQIVEGLAQNAYDKASPYFAPVVKTARAQLPVELIERLEHAAASASTYSHHLLEQVDTASDVVTKKLHEAGENLQAVRKSPEIIAAKVSEGNAYFQSQVIPALPTSLADVKTLGLESYESLKAALTKLRESLPTSFAEVQAKVPEEQVEKIKGAINGVLDMLPKLPELPKIDLSKYNSHELVKFGHSLLDRITPYIAPYQSRIEKLLVDYKVAERAGALQKSAQGYYKQFGVEKVAPTFVTGFVLGDEKEVVPVEVADAAVPPVQ